MKRVLLINEWYPLPEYTGSNQRTMFLARFLSKFARVDLLYSSGKRKVDIGDPVFENEFCIAKDQSSLNYKDQLHLLLKGIPWCIQSRYSRAYQERLFSLIDEQQYDLILVRYMFNAQYFLNIPDNKRYKVIIDVDDVLSGPLYHLVHKVATRYIVKEWLDHKLLMRYERRCIRKSDISLFCSREESDRIHVETPLFSKKVFVVPNIVNPSMFQENDLFDGYSLSNTLLFLGSLSYIPNVEGLEWFVRHVFDPFTKSFHDAKMLVIGNKPNETVVNLCNKTERIELHANVPDVRPHYASSRAVVVPLIRGGGTRIKILEASLANRPVLSTPIGAEGLRFIDGEEILLFDDADTFMEQYLLLQEKEYYSKIVRMARKKTEKEYSPKRLEESLNEVMKHL